MSIVELGLGVALAACKSASYPAHADDGEVVCIPAGLWAAYVTEAERTCAVLGPHVERAAREIAEWST